MKEEQNYQKVSEQLDFLNGTIKSTVNKNDKDRGGDFSTKSKEEIAENYKKQNSPENLLILDTETTGLDNENDDCIEVGSILFNVKSLSLIHI